EVHGRRAHGHARRTAMVDFLRNHARETWACDFLQAYDVFFRPIFAFVFIELACGGEILVPRKFASAAVAEGADAGRMSDATKVRVEVQQGGLRWPRVARGHGRPWGKAGAHKCEPRVYLRIVCSGSWTRGQSGALGPRERGARANRVTRGLVTERCSTVSWCRSKAISASSVQRGRSASARAAGGTRTASRTSAKVTPTPSTSR